MEKVCFVIMGYGVKTDLATGRELNLDKTYTNIIKPAVEEAGLKCIRADEIKHSGIIDIPMYAQLIAADVVIADLSTNNSNAFYELGVRHALRPKTTIAISENKLKPPFDINHTVIYQYEHFGPDIGYDEVIRFRKLLVETITQVLNKEDTDSPVYTFLKGLNPPFFSDGFIEVPLEEKENTLNTIVFKANSLMEKDDFFGAKSLYQAAIQIDPTNDYLVQKFVLATYKSEYPNKLEALNEALKILEDYNIAQTTDPEFLGLTGAIYKRLWETKKDKGSLDKSISNYEKGFYIKNDYYNGINLAYLYNERSANFSTDINECITDYVTASRIRKRVVGICKELIETTNFDLRQDKYWIFATLEEAYFGIGDIENYQEYCALSIINSKVNWERKTTEDQINKLQSLLVGNPLIQNNVN